MQAHRESLRVEREKKRREDIRMMRFKVDELLDKINATGYESLTDDEKRFLRNASKHYKSS